MSQFIIGIDLGTTNSALAYAPDSRDAEVALFPVPQLANPGEVAEFDLLPSSLYLPGEKEFVEGSLALPWNGAAFLHHRPFCAVTRRGKCRTLSEFG